MVIKSFPRYSFPDGNAMIREGEENESLRDKDEDEDEDEGDDENVRDDTWMVQRRNCKAC